MSSLLNRKIGIGIPSPIFPSDDIPPGVAQISTHHQKYEVVMYEGSS
jgi:hypothetical protein